MKNLSNRAGTLLLRNLALVCGLLLAINTAAQSPSVQTLEQLKNLPVSEQKRLARQFGVELPEISAQAPSRLAEPVVGARVADDDALPPAQEPSSQTAATTAQQPLPRYGRALFDRQVSTFAATDNNSVPDSYRIGVGDELVVQLYGNESDTLNLQVGRNGQVVAPKLGPLALAGLTFESASELLRQRVAEQLIGVEAVVSMGRLRAINVFLAGEVAVPGAFSVSALTTVTQALFQAGGVSDIGSLRNIQIKRDGETAGSFDAYDLLLRGDASGDLRLRSGDVVFVPPYQALAEVSGAVKRPMLYELKGYETVDDLVAMAGGLTRAAYTGMATLSRIDPASGLPTIETVAIGAPEVKRTAVRNGDLLRVLESGSELSNVVTVKGAAYRSGEFGWRPNLRVSDLIQDVYRDLLPIADPHYSIITSVANEQMDIELTQFSVAGALAAKGSQADPLLKPRDTIYLFALPALAQLDSSADKPASRRTANEPAVRAQVPAAAQRSQLGQLDQPELERDQSLDPVEQPLDPIEQFDRERMLEPVLEKLRRQARFGQPVQTVSVSGAVRAPGTYPFFAGATAADLIFAAGGLTQSAFTQAAELRRLEKTTQGEVEAEYREVDLTEVLRGEPLPLQSRDHLAVRDIPHWSPVDSVVIEGEVRFPGTYLIEKGETIAGLIARAGGATDEAFLAGAIFTRSAIAEKEREQAQQFARSIQKTYAVSMLTEESKDESLDDIRAIAEQLESFEGQGRLLIDLAAIMAGQQSSDIELVDGDKLVISKKISTVTVVGEVQQPGSHLFNHKASVNDYLALSAGITKRADKRAIYVVKANGMVRPLQRGLFKRSAKLEAGDTIVIPVDSAYKESLTAWREITQIFYQSAVSLAAVLAL